MAMATKEIIIEMLSVNRRRIVILPWFVESFNMCGLMMVESIMQGLIYGDDHPRKHELLQDNALASSRLLPLLIYKIYDCVGD